MFFGPSGCFLFAGPADFADHDDRFGLRVFVEQLEDIEVRSPVDWIATDAYTGALAHPEVGDLPNRFVGQRHRPGNDADATTAMNVTRSDPDPATARGIVRRGPG